MKTPRATKKKPEEIDRVNLKEFTMSSEDWQEFEHGVTLFNSGKFWNSHEAWEQVWLRHDEDERLFFQGLIQLAAAYHQLTTKKSYKGMMNNFDKAYEKLVVFQPEYLGIYITPLVKFIEQGKKEAEKLGADGLEQFNYNLVPKMQFHKPHNPDLLVEVRAILRSEQFLEGLRLFNKGYHWEAHEAWEDVWRELEGGDAKTFAQAFVQVAAGYSFVASARVSSAKYLFEKSSEKLRQFEHIECDLDIKPLVAELQQALDSMNGGTTLQAKLKIPVITLLPRKGSSNGS